MTPTRIKIAFFGLGFLFFVITLSFGPLPQRILPQDVFIMLTAAEKIDRGLISYVDFRNYLGPIPVLPIVMGMNIVGIVPYALDIGQAITIPFIFGLTWFLFLRHQPNLPNLFVAVYIASTWCSPTELHRLFFSISSAMYYDREGLAILSLLLMVGLNTFAYDGLWCGILLGILFFIKIPFAVCGAPLALIVIVRQRFIPAIMQIAFGFIMVVIALGSYVGFGALTSLILFIYSISRIQDHEMLLARILQTPYDSMVFLAVVPIVFYFISQERKLAQRVYLELACVIAASVSSSFIDGPTLHFPDSPIAVTYGLYLAGKHSIVNEKVLFWYIILSAFVINNLLGYARLVDLKLLPKKDSMTGYVNSPGFENFPLTGGLNIYCPTDTPLYVSINDGLELIAKHPELKDKKIACLGFTDYFSLARHVPSPDHMPVVLQTTMTVSEGNVPPADLLLGDCDGIIINKKVTVDEKGSTIFFEHSNDYIDKNFPKRDESERWILRYK